jgi:hypothetical protein
MVPLGTLLVPLAVLVLLHGLAAVVISGVLITTLVRLGSPAMRSGAGLVVLGCLAVRFSVLALGTLRRGRA